MIDRTEMDKMLAQLNESGGISNDGQINVDMLFCLMLNRIGALEAEVARLTDLAHTHAAMPRV